MPTIQETLENLISITREMPGATISLQREIIPIEDNARWALYRQGDTITVTIKIPVSKG